MQWTPPGNEGTSVQPPRVRWGRPTSDSHTVKPGETLGTIANLYGIDPIELGRLNGIAPHTPLEAGKRLRFG